MKQIIIALSWLALQSGSCQKAGNPEQKTAPEPTQVPVVPVIKEGSGIADSKTNPGKLWVIEDSGNPPELVLVGHDGRSGPRLPIAGATNRDWEDLVLAGGQLYIGDIGDNEQKASAYIIYRMAEPAFGATAVSEVTKIRFRYNNGPHDAEAFLVDAQSGSIYIITKRDATAQVFKIAGSYSTTAENIAEKVADLDYNNVVSAALSPDGKQVLVKTYDKIFRYSRNDGESVEEALKKKPAEMPYKGEPQGEAVCFKQDGSGYFTLSEQLFGKEVNLYFYKQP